MSKARRDAWRRGLSVVALGAGCLMLFAIAGTAGWLSFAAQRGYAHSRNGGDWDAATGFALLLDAGTLGLSLFRFFEALTLRSSGLTRLLLIAFVGASAAMNYLHAPASESGVVDFGSRFVAVIPPLVYAVLLEMLLFKVEQVIMEKRPKRRQGRERGYSLLLWVPFVGYPGKVWAAWREDLHSTLKNVRAPGSLKAPLSSERPVVASESDAMPRSSESSALVPALETTQSARGSEPETTPQPELAEAGTPITPREPVTAASMTPPTASPRSEMLPTQRTGENPLSPAKRRLSMKEMLFEGLVQEMRCGDWDAVSDDTVTRTAAWVRVNTQLGKEQGRGTLMTYDSARNAFRDFMPELRSMAEQIRAERREAAEAKSPGGEKPLASTAVSSAPRDLGAVRDSERQPVNA
ncbi:DUF2637 domain-containing protein [Streptomyces sp. NPDC097610]|uniref:DUF2637 domain-containing protein n=1 Tax=Streptomyces sp. NPDC097610 TaxID=3157227 RepID=UPI00332A06C3